MNIELILEEKNRSKVIKLKENSDVAKWVEPVLFNIKKRNKSKETKESSAITIGEKKELN